MIKATTFGTIQDGKLTIIERKKFEKAIKTFPDCTVQISVKKLYKQRSIEQNKYYWQCIVSAFVEGAAEEWGKQLSSEEAHEDLKVNCNFEEVYSERTGKMIKIIKSSANLTTVEAEEYYERCRRFILEWFGITVYLPNEQTKFNTNENYKRIMR